MNPDQHEALRRLPALGKLLESELARQWIDVHGRRLVADVLREAIEEVRERIVAGEAVDDDLDDAVLELAGRLLPLRAASSLVRAVNATGIVLHTGLGRAPLAARAVQSIAEAAGGYCNLEFELETGRRGRRQRHVTGLICELTGAEAATVVNNNAAATLLILRTLAAGREVIVSRGELVEIGGSFRLPGVMEASGAVLREVGTTNRTRIGDYEAAINDQTAVLMRVHTSNYRIVGFTEDTPMGPIAELAHRFGLLAVDDLGSGTLIDLREAGLPYEPMPADSIAAGADVVCFSGDKLLGGPQCGVICGRRDLIDRIQSHPLMRTYRVDKLTLLALEATLRLSADPAEAMRSIPALAMLAADTDELAGRAETLQQELDQALPAEDFIVCSDVSYAGGGSMPTDALETVVVQWRPASGRIQASAAALREAGTPVVARVRDDAIVFDLRTIGADEFDAIVAAVRHAAET